MTVRPKNHRECDTMRQGGQILNRVLQLTQKFVQPGKTLKEIDAYIHDEIIKNRATPAFLGYHGFPASSCLSVNSAVVHGIPNDYSLSEGDILGIDVGVKYKGYYTDAAFTMPIGKISKSARQLLHVTQQALHIGLEQAIAGNEVSAIGTAIESYVRSQGSYGIIRDLAGHGVGQKLQELPEVLNYRNRNATPLVSGMTLAIEPMISTGSFEVVIEQDGWTVTTKDDSLAAQFETTCIIQDERPEILVPFPLIVTF